MAMTRKRRRLIIVVTGMAILGLAATLVLSAFEDNLVFFYSPTDLVEKHVAPGKRVRIGGLVESDSVEKQSGGTTVRFRVTDGANVLAVEYSGILPDLFREGQGVVAEGRLTPAGDFVADSVLAKHDENYMPPEVADAIKRTGEWRGDQAQ